VGEQLYLEDFYAIAQVEGGPLYAGVGRLHVMQQAPENINGLF